MRVAVYAISKNEAAHVERFLASVGEADLVLVADTGSTDDTVERLRAGGAAVHAIEVRPWRFDVARNRTLALLPDDIDACLSLDLDEVAQPGWRAAVEAAWVPGVTRLRYRYVSIHTSDGESDVEHTVAKVHARDGYRWRYAVHEDIEPIDPSSEVIAVALDMRVDHLPDLTKPRGDYLALLELVTTEEPESSQHAFWLGREYIQHARWDQAVAELQRYLALPAANWEPERAAAMRHLARAFAALGQPLEAESWLLRACAETPEEREPWIELAQACHNIGDWAGCFAAARRELAITERPRHYLSEGLAWGERADDLASVCAWRLGAHDVARAHASAALRFAPDNPRIATNVQFMTAEDKSGTDGNSSLADQSLSDVICFADE